MRHIIFHGRNNISSEPSHVHTLQPFCLSISRYVQLIHTPAQHPPARIILSAICSLRQLSTHNSFNMKKSWSGKCPTYHSVTFLSRQQNMVKIHIWNTQRWPCITTSISNVGLGHMALKIILQYFMAMSRLGLQQLHKIIISKLSRPTALHNNYYLHRGGYVFTHTRLLVAWSDLIISKGDT